MITRCVLQGAHQVLVCACAQALKKSIDRSPYPGRGPCTVAPGSTSLSHGTCRYVDLGRAFLSSGNGDFFNTVKYFFGSPE